MDDVAAELSDGGHPSPVYKEISEQSLQRLSQICGVLVKAAGDKTKPYAGTALYSLAEDSCATRAQKAATKRGPPPSLRGWLSATGRPEVGPYLGRGGYMLCKPQSMAIKCRLSSQRSQLTQGRMQRVLVSAVLVVSVVSAASRAWPVSRFFSVAPPPWPP